MQLSISQMPPDRDICSTPERLWIDARDLLCPVSDRSHRAARLKFVDFEESTFVQFRPLWDGDSVDVGREHVPHPTDLAWLDALLRQRRSDAIPVSVVEHCAGAISI